jgi:uncharacterized protein (TIGR03663 family)
MTESVLDRPVVGKFTVERTAYVLVLLVALLLRTYELGIRPYHHDESIHAFFSWKIVQNGLDEYKYDPVYHGPVLYYSTALALFLGENDFGRALGAVFPVFSGGRDGDFVGRLSAVAFGIVVLAFAWPLRRHLGRWGALCFLVLVAFSPGWVYFTRFVRHDIYLAGCNLAAIYWAFRYGETRRASFLYLAAAALALAFCTKEDNYFLTPIFLLALVLGLVWEVFHAADKKAAWSGIVGECRAFLAQSWLPLLTSAIIFACIWIVFYTSFLNHMDKWDAMRPALKYWMGQHQIKRIGGPWWYYAPQLAFYDPLILFPLAILVLDPLVGRRPRTALGSFFYFAGVVSGLVFLGGVLYELMNSTHWLIGDLHVTPLPLVLTFGFALGSLATQWMPDRFTRFAILTSLGCLTIYGWAQEKVPWLLVPQLLPLTLLAGHWYGRLIEKGALLKPGGMVPVGAMAAFTLWTLVNVCYVWDAPKPDEAGARLNPPVRHEEMLSYVQSTYDIHEVMDRIEHIGKVIGSGTQTRLAVSGDATWPFSWYLRDYPVNWSANLRNIDQPVVIVDKSVEKSTDKVLLDTYEKVTFQIRGWWEPDWKKFTPPNVAKWLLTRVVWSGTGSSDAVLYAYKNPQPGVKEFATLTVNPPPAARGYPRGPKSLEPVGVWGGRGSGRGEYNEPRGLAVDGAGNLYVADTKNHRVQKLSPDGQVLTVWGSEGEGPGQFKDPHGVAVGPDGSVFVADTWNHRIQKFDPSGAFLLEFGKEEPGFWGPRAVAVSPEAVVFVSDTGNKRIVSFSAQGQLIESWGADGSAPRQFIEPVGLAVNGQGELLVADTGNRRIQVFLPDGTFVREFEVFGWEEFYTEPYVAVAGDSVYVTDSYNHRFARYGGGQFEESWGKTGSGAGNFNRPIGIAAGPGGVVYVSDTMNHRVQKFVIPVGSDQ